MKNNQRGFILSLVVIVVAAIAVSGGIYYAQKAKSPTSDIAAQNEAFQAEVQATSTINGDISATSTATSSAKTKKDSLRSLLALNKDVSCTISSKIENTSTEGTIFNSGKMMRGDFVTTTGSKGTVETHLIRNNTDVYAWTGTQGAKMSVGDFESKTQASSSTPIDLDQKVEYSCADWKPDSAKFTIPTNVKFINLSAIINAGIDIKGLINR